MKHAFVLLEGDVVQWAHAQAATKGTSVSSLLSELLRERMEPGRPHEDSPVAAGQTGTHYSSRPQESDQV